MSLNNDTAIRLWGNARDSIRHALEHFSELNQRGSEKYHHQKWIVLSVHHAAETFCYALLKELDENNPVFYKKGRHYYSGLEAAINALLSKTFLNDVLGYEKKLLKLFRKMDKPRNSIIHGEVPEEIDISIMAMVLIGISRVATKRCGESADDIVQQYPTVQKDVVEAIHSTRLEEYKKFIETFFVEEMGNRPSRECPSCGAKAIIYGHCEACFEDISEITCPHCEDNILIIADFPFAQNCFECGNAVTTDRTGA